MKRDIQQITFRQASILIEQAGDRMYHYTYRSSPKHSTKIGEVKLFKLNGSYFITGNTEAIKNVLKRFSSKQSGQLTLS